MTELIAAILPFAFGVFASPLPVIVGILMLFSDRPRSTSGVYVATWLAGLTAVTVMFTVLAGFIEAGTHPPDWVVWLRVIVGLALIVAAVRQWLARASKATPAWLSMVMSSGPKEAIRYGVLMSAANPKELLMALPAGLAVGSSGVGLGAAAVAIAVFVLVGGLSVILPLLVFVLGGQHSLDRLETARDVLKRHNAAVTAIVLAVLGVWLLVGGILKLLG